ncbi:ROK family transcriptional regulator [Branchiibius cervicis]|uniref:ROK family transcriptional regulator n=1 Tax=Branchiibius cervicis TaxID=908252 RepID=A0ABW2ATA8_9MICO
MTREYSSKAGSAKSADAAAAVIPRTVQRRWEVAGEVLRLLHTTPGVTRAQAVEQLGISSASATDLFDRLRQCELLTENPAPATGPGRPTTLLAAAPQGPLIGVLDLAGSSWQILLADLAGDVTRLAHGAYADATPARFIPRLAKRLAEALSPYADRVLVVSVAVAGTVTGNRLLQFAGEQPQPADLAPLLRGLPSHAALLVDNDATLGGLAEARTGAARGAASCLHLLLTGGIGGVMVIDGAPVVGASGAAGEFGHMPFGDPAQPCPCGAFGCWSRQVDATVLDAGEPAAIEAVAHAFGRGVGALVNGLDPQVVTVGGLAPAVMAADPTAFERGYHDGLMAFRRSDPPPVLAASHDDGPVAGAVSRAIDELTTPAVLEGWTAR